MSEENKCIVFTDIKKSSLLWDKFGDKMAKSLQRHFGNVSDQVKKNQGLVIKTIGDAHMISFNTLEQGIKFATSMCYENIDVETNQQIETKLFENNDDLKNESDIKTLQMRIGMCYGPVQKKTEKVQNCDVVDYFGSTVNLASRMESKVSKVGSFGVCIAPKENELKNETVNDYENVKSVISVLDKVCKPCDGSNDNVCKCNVKILLYKNSCPGEPVRSERMLLESDCKPLDVLNSGKKEVVAFRINPKLV